LATDVTPTGIRPDAIKMEKLGIMFAKRALCFRWCFRCAKQ
jgi:hypothetical protein